jgi:DNA sulfur modification protein DndD
VTYKTTHGSGQRAGFQPPNAFRRFLNPNFVNFFVFDGELAQRLLDRTQTNAEAAVEALFQINMFSTLQQRVREYWTDKTAGVSATEERGLSRRGNRVKDLEDRLAKLRAERAKLEAKQGELGAQLKAREEAYNQEIKKDEALSHNINSAAVDAERYKGVVREYAAEVFEAMRDPYALSPTFAGDIMNLKAGLDRAKLPGSAAREFFNDISEEKDCICGRPIDEHIKLAIRDRASLYLASDDVSFLNVMKETIQQAVGESTTAPEKATQEKIAQLENCVKDERGALNTLDELRLRAEEADPEVKKAKEETDSLKRQLAEIADQLEKFESKESQLGDDHTFGISILEKRLKDAEKKLSEITQTVHLKTKRDILVKILSSAHAKARAALTEEICEESNRRILELMPHNRIFIEKIDRSLLLRDQHGGSVGETLSIAYAFLSTLFNRSEHKLPFIVDSPAGPIDLAIRPKIGDLIPNLTDQFVAFTISSERDKFVPRLKAAAKDDVKFITVFRKGSKELQSAARAAADVSETDDGFVVGGEQFFNDFQIEEEAT